MRIRRGMSRVPGGIEAEETSRFNERKGVSHPQMPSILFYSKSEPKPSLTPGRPTASAALKTKLDPTAADCVGRPGLAVRDRKGEVIWLARSDFCFGHGTPRGFE